MKCYCLDTRKLSFFYVDPAHCKRPEDILVKGKNRQIYGIQLFRGKNLRIFLCVGLAKFRFIGLGILSDLVKVVRREKMVFSEKVTVDGLQLAKIGYLKLSAFIGLDPSANFYPIKRRHFKDIEEKLRKLFKSRKSQGNFKEGKNFMETVIINGLRTASFVHKKLTQTEPTYPGLRKGNFVMNFGDLKQILSLTKLIWNDVAKITLNVLASCDLTSQNGGFILINLSH